MSKSIDAVGIAAYLTGTQRDVWEAIEGPNDADGEEFWLEEVEGFGPSEDQVGRMVRQGYVEGKGWKLTTEIDLQEDDSAAEYIGSLIADGFTSGIDPTWSVDIRNRQPRQAYVNVDGDDVTIEIGVQDGIKEVVKVTTIDAIAADPELSAFLVDREPAPAVR